MNHPQQYVLFFQSNSQGLLCLFALGDVPTYAKHQLLPSYHGSVGDPDRIDFRELRLFRIQELLETRVIDTSGYHLAIQFPLDPHL